MPTDKEILKNAIYTTNFKEVIGAALTIANQNINNVSWFITEKNPKEFAKNAVYGIIDNLSAKYANASEQELREVLGKLKSLATVDKTTRKSILIEFGVSAEAADKVLDLSAGIGRQNFLAPLADLDIEAIMAKRAALIEKYKPKEAPEEAVPAPQKEPPAVAKTPKGKTAIPKVEEKKEGVAEGKKVGREEKKPEAGTETAVVTDKPATTTPPPVEQKKEAKTSTDKINENRLKGDGLELLEDPTSGIVIGNQEDKPKGLMETIMEFIKGFIDNFFKGGEGKEGGGFGEMLAGFFGGGKKDDNPQQTTQQEQPAVAQATTPAVQPHQAETKVQTTQSPKTETKPEQKQDGTVSAEPRQDNLRQPTEADVQEAVAVVNGKKKLDGYEEKNRGAYNINNQALENVIGVG